MKIVWTHEGLCCLWCENRKGISTLHDNKIVHDEKSKGDLIGMYIHISQTDGTLEPIFNEENEVIGLKCPTCKRELYFTKKPLCKNRKLI